MAALIFVAGMLTVAAVEEMLEEAHDAQEDNRLSVVAFLGGFALFTLVSAGLETVIGEGGSERSKQSHSWGVEERGAGTGVEGFQVWVASLAPRAPAPTDRVPEYRAPE